MHKRVSVRTRIRYCFHEIRYELGRYGDERFISWYRRMFALEDDAPILCQRQKMLTCILVRVVHLVSSKIQNLHARRIP